MNSYKMPGSLYSKTTRGVKQVIQIHLTAIYTALRSSGKAQFVAVQGVLLLRFRARFAAERVMREQPVAFQPDDDRVAGRQFHIGGVPLVTCDYDGKTIRLRIIYQRESAQPLYIQVGLDAVLRP